MSPDARHGVRVSTGTEAVLRRYSWMSSVPQPVPQQFDPLLVWREKPSIVSNQAPIIYSHIYKYVMYLCKHYMDIIYGNVPLCES